MINIQIRLHARKKTTHKKFEQLFILSHATPTANVKKKFSQQNYNQIITGKNIITILHSRSVNNSTAFFFHRSAKRNPA